jgi:hypothetical protein
MVKHLFTLSLTRHWLALERSHAEERRGRDMRIAAAIILMMFAIMAITAPTTVAHSEILVPFTAQD